MILEFRTIVPKALQGKGSRVYLRFLSAHNVTFNESLKSYYLRNYERMVFIFNSRIFFSVFTLKHKFSILICMISKTW